MIQGGLPSCGGTAVVCTTNMGAVLSNPAVAEAAVGLLLGSCRQLNSSTAAARQTSQQKGQQRKVGATAASAAGRWWQQQQMLELPRAHELLEITGGHQLVTATTHVIKTATPACNLAVACASLNAIYDCAAEVTSFLCCCGVPC